MPIFKSEEAFPTRLPTTPDHTGLRVIFAAHPEIPPLAGVTVRILRYYDKIGLLKSVSKTEGSHRLYTIKTRRIVPILLV